MSKIHTAPVTGRIADVPVVMQMEALECGAACLTMILAYYGKWIPLEEVREACGVSRDGSKAGNINRAARGYGLTARGIRIEPQTLKEEGSFPCIVHWEFNHFIVLKGFRGGKAYINDPARGNISMSEHDFDEGFTGICLQFEPGEAFEPSGRPSSILAFARKRMEGTGSAVAFVVLTTTISGIAGILSAGFSRVFMDQLLTGYDLNLLVPFLIGLSVFSVLQIIAAWIQAFYSFRIGGKLAVIGNTSYFWHVLRLPMRFFSQRWSGDIEQRRATNEVIAGTLVNTLAPIVLNTAMMIFYLAVMLRYSVFLTSIGILCVALSLFFARFISAKRINITRVMMRDEGKLASSTVAGIEMIETIKASGAESGYFSRWSGYRASVNTQTVRYLRLDACLGALPVILNSLVNDIVLILGVWLVMKGQFTAGMVLAFQGFLQAFLMPADSIIEAGQSIQELRTQMERVEDVMHYPIDPMLADRDISGGGEPVQNAGQADTHADISEDKLSGGLTMHHVTFGYSPLEPPLIEDFDLTLTPGKSVAFVGTSGCGKSTLAKLISGLYTPWQGEILFDGRRIEEIDRDVFTGSVAVVDQEITLFEDTIAGNIKMWDESIEDFEMILAARDARLHEDIMQREGGYQYRLIEGGRDFSGGQRQRMEIARVLAQDPTLIIMDEATSALDARTEYDVVRSIRDRGVTTVVIAHRLSTIRDCDEIIVMDHGRVIERGSHEELMKLGGYYKDLITAE